MILEGKREENFQIKMICQNHIAGLLPMHYYAVDDKNKYYYDISQKRAVQDIWGNGQYHLQNLQDFMMSLYLCTQKMEEYLLDINHLLLYPDYVYQDVKTGEIYFCFYPNADSSLMDSIKELLENLMNQADYEDKVFIEVLYALQNIVSETYCTVKDLVECCMNPKSESASGRSEEKQMADRSITGELGMEEYQVNEKKDAEQDKNNRHENHIEERKENQEGYKGRKVIPRNYILSMIGTFLLICICIMICTLIRSVV